MIRLNLCNDEVRVKNIVYCLIDSSRNILSTKDLSKVVFYIDIDIIETRQAVAITCFPQDDVITDVICMKRRTKKTCKCTKQLFTLWRDS